MKPTLAMAPGDIRAGTPPSAELAPDPEPATTRTVIGDGPHVLSREALALWPVYIHIGHQTQMNTFLQSFGQETTDNLQTLKSNVASLGATTTWFQRGNGVALELKPSIAERLMQGLLIDVRHLPQLLKLLTPNGTRQEALRVALMKLAREEPMRPIITKIQSELERRGVDLRDPVSAPIKEEIAAVVGTTVGNVGTSIAVLRREGNIPTPPKNWTTVPHEKREKEQPVASEERDTPTAYKCLLDLHQRCYPDLPQPWGETALEVNITSYIKSLETQLAELRLARSSAASNPEAIRTALQKTVDARVKAVLAEQAAERQETALWALVGGGE